MCDLKKVGTLPRMTTYSGQAGVTPLHGEELGITQPMMALATWSHTYLVCQIQNVAATQANNIPPVCITFLNVVLKIQSIPVCTSLENPRGSMGRLDCCDNIQGSTVCPCHVLPSVECRDARSCLRNKLLSLPIHQTGFWCVQLCTSELFVYCPCTTVQANYFLNLFSFLPSCVQFVLCHCSQYGVTCHNLF